jgi:anti-repressor protein
MEMITIKKLTGLTSIEVAEITGKQHKHIMRDIVDEMGKLGDEIGRSIFGLSSYVNSQNKEQPMYNLTKDGVLQLGARYDAKIRFSLIQRMNKLEEERKFNIPTTLSAALFLAADQAKVIEEQVEVIETLNVKIVEDTPKVNFATALANSKDTMLVRGLARMLKQSGIDTGGNRLYEILRVEGYLGKEGTEYNLPTQKSMNLGIMEVKTSVGKSANGNEKQNRTTVITTKGCSYFVNLFKKSNVIAI